MKVTEEKASLCALGKVFGFKPRIALALIEHLGSARAVFDLKENDINGLLSAYPEYSGQINRSLQDESLKELLSLEERGIRYVGWGEETYPQLLKECEDPPIGLYIRSDTQPSELWSRNRSIAIVGTRDISDYGREWCSRICHAIADAAPDTLIISGLAYGTDIIAHRTALERGLPTIGVMATGPENIYPYRHRAVAEQMAHSPGCALVTDYPPGTAPLALHFLRRNRIIAGLADSTILIESKIKGGGMSTARLAFSYSRDVFALPGRIDDTRSQGCNLLINNKTAEPIISLMQMLKSMGIKTEHIRHSERLTERVGMIYGKIEKDRIEMLSDIIGTIKGNRGISIEELAEKCGFTFARTADLCNMLESDGIIIIDILQRCCINTNFF